MTLDQLKSLKVGQIVKYTNDVDALNVEYYRKIYMLSDCIVFTALNKSELYTIHFNDPDINHIASMLTIDQPLRDKVLEPQRQLERELRLIEAKIRDAEFDLRTVMRETEFMYKIHGSLSGLMQEEIIKATEVLTNLRHQRNELIEKI